jgi:hypothetical protein
MPERVEPRYDHPEFQAAFQELDQLLASRFDADPLVEFMDLMMYGFWGEGHTSDYANPFPDPLTAERTFVGMTRQQMEAWKRVPLAVNTQPDISRTGNHEVHDLAVRGGCWLRSDSIILDEPVQIESLAHRPPWLAVIMEDGYHRHYRTDTPSYRVDAAGASVIDRALLHTLDLGGNYWSLWTEAPNLARYHEERPAALGSAGASATASGRPGSGSASATARPSWSWPSPTTGPRASRACCGWRSRPPTGRCGSPGDSTPAILSRAGSGWPRSCCRRGSTAAR